MGKHFALLESVKQAMTTTAMGAALLKVESELHESGCLTQEWSDRWREYWREEIVTCSHLQESLLHVAALQALSIPNTHLYNLKLTAVTFSLPSPKNGLSLDPNDIKIHTS